MTTSLSDTSRPLRPGALALALRVVIALGAVAVLTQAVLAGEIVSGTSGAEMVHGVVAQVVAVLSLIQVVLAVIAWRRGSASGRVAVLSSVVLVAVAGQMVAGGMAALAVHVPLGVALFGGYVWLLFAGRRA